MTKGYFLHDYVWRFRISEVDIVAEWVDGRGKARCTIQNERYIWDSDTGAQNDPALHNEPQVIYKDGGGFGNKLYTSLAEIEKIVDGKKQEALAAARRNLRKAEVRVTQMEDVLANGWQDFPKEEYVSPFTGKTV